MVYQPSLGSFQQIALDLLENNCRMLNSVKVVDFFFFYKHDNVEGKGSTH